MRASYKLSLALGSGRLRYSEGLDFCEIHCDDYCTDCDRRPD